MGTPGGPGGGYIEFTFTVDGVDTVERKLLTWGQAIEDLSPALEQIGDDLRADFAANVASEGGLFAGGRGAVWAPLAASTQRERARLGYGAAHPILVRSGVLASSVFQRGAAGNISEVGKLSARFGTASPIAPFHQLGTSKMPARKLVGLTWRRKAIIVQRVGDYVRQLATRAGLHS